MAVSLALAALIILINREKAQNPSELCGRCLLVIAAVFLLSPTQFPWYYTWLVPFLVFRPRTPLLLLTALLPLYYLRFYFDARNEVGIFDYGVVWLEYAPVWFLLIREWRIGRRGGARPPVTKEAAA